MNTNTEQRRESRADLARLARPQGGVDTLAGRFPQAKGAPAGVADNGDPHTRPVPTLGIKAAERTAQ
jgi:hypothetical protein